MPRQGKFAKPILRTKATYNKDSVALYTLISSDEREDMLRKIEEAYEVLSSTERRKEYDRHHGLLSAEEELAAFSRHAPSKKIISIDRVPPMDSTGSSDDLLVAPSTDFTNSANAEASDRDPFFESAPAGAPAKPPGPPQRTPPGAPPAQAAPPSAAARAAVASGIAEEIAKEADWHGSFIRRIRELRRVSIEELSAVTKITKSYIQAIEEENFGRLPAAVYLRGFIIQIAKVLKLPHEKVAGGYMARYYQARPDQAK